MNPAPTSLEALHDIVLPAPVPWWPPAPGWYAVLALLALAAAWLARRAWRTWRADAYRRAALRELARARDAAAIAELLRRTALAVADRAVVARLTGAAWADWVAARSPAAMPPGVRTALTAGVYGPSDPGPEVDALREYAARWIACHRPGPPDALTPG